MQLLYSRGIDVDFDLSASDYRRYRPDYPSELFERLLSYGVGRAGQRIVDLGAGTGVIARALARRGAAVVGVDRAASLQAEAERMDLAAGVSVRYVTADAESTGLPAASFDAVIAASSWHWLRQPQASDEVKRLLVAGGAAVVCYFDRVALPGNVVAATEALIARYHSDWQHGSSDGVYPQALTDLGRAGFVELESFSFDRAPTYTHDSWRGRIRASAGVAASLSPAQVAAFDRELGELLAAEFPTEPMTVPHRVYAIVARKPGD